MCIGHGYNPQIIFYYFFHKFNLVILTAKTTGFKVFLLATPLHFYDDSFDTLQVFRSWFEDVHMVWIWS